MQVICLAKCIRGNQSCEIGIGNEWIELRIKVILGIWHSCHVNVTLSSCIYSILLVGFIIKTGLVGKCSIDAVEEHCAVLVSSLPTICSKLKVSKVMSAHVIPPWPCNSTQNALILNPAHH